MVVMDAEERGDQNALGFVSIGLLVVEKWKCTITISRLDMDML